MINMWYVIKGWDRSRIKVNKFLKHFSDDQYWCILLEHEDVQKWLNLQALTN